MELHLETDAVGSVVDGALEPLRPAAGGVYRDEYVTVLRGPVPSGREIVHTPHFTVHAGEPLAVTHLLDLEDLDEDLTGLLQSELFEPGWVRGAELFERLFTGIVITCSADPLVAWESFYRNTIERQEAIGGHTGSAIEQFRPVHDHAVDLVVGESALELGSCFGFLALRLAAQGRAVTASDLSVGTMQLLGAVAPRLGTPLATLVADAGHVPAADRSFDTVLAVHLLEHIDAPHGDRVLAEAVRLADRRVIVGVPYEDVADETFGHVRTVGPDDLSRWGLATGLSFEVHEHHVGWLVIDR